MKQLIVFIVSMLLIGSCALYAQEDVGVIARRDRERVVTWRLGINQTLAQELRKPIRQRDDRVIRTMRFAQESPDLIELLSMQYEVEFNAMEATYDGTVMVDGTPLTVGKDGRVLKFLQFIIDNKEEIIAFIELIMRLFASIHHLNERDVDPLDLVSS